MLFDLVKLAFGVVAGAGALVALVVAYRLQRVDEDGALREATRLHTERFTAAVGQLGDASAAVRLGGVHALAGLADDAPTRELRQTCIDVLCAYLRLPYTAEADLPTGDAEARHTYMALREVRHTIIRLIRDHLRLNFRHPRTWQRHNFDLTGVVFDGGDFAEAEFFWGTTVSFDGAEFSGGKVYFNRAEFTGGTVTFVDAKFSGGGVYLVDAKFSDSMVNFGRAKFSAGQVFFVDAEFSNGTVYFGQAKFSGGEANFIGAKLSGGLVDFDGAEFSGSRVTFGLATFSGSTVRFDGATGTAPLNLVPPNTAPLPAGLTVPGTWRTTGP
ncbi:pentapeptide repeat-containing protein [Streptomyces sp. NPDC050988]|uniref:pentapeptide repeat-containing protein n=1 Tax=Streptomyces sp. NPDC050988 TaxID=3365637 RepID=UPI0037B16BCB